VNYLRYLWKNVYQKAANMWNKVFKTKSSIQQENYEPFFSNNAMALTHLLIGGKLQTLNICWYIVLLANELSNTSKNKNYKLNDNSKYVEITFERKKYATKTMIKIQNHVI